MADILKQKDDMGFAGADAQGDWSDRATNWQSGAQVDCDTIINESKEQASAAGVPVDCSYSQSLYSGNNARGLLGSPHNKRGPKAGVNMPFDAASLTDDLQASYKADPPIAQDNLSAQPGMDGSPQTLTSGYSGD